MAQETDWPNLPLSHTADGKPRRIGVEIEMAGVDLDAICATTAAEFGGDCSSDGAYLRRLETRSGDFVVELDASILKDRVWRTRLADLGIEIPDDDANRIDQWIADVAGQVVPQELVAPPIPLAELPRLDRVRARLRDIGARGTSTSLAYAFGLQLNVEIATADPRWIHDILRAFLILYDSLREDDGIDLTRRLSPYVKPFPSRYLRRLFEQGPPDSLAALIDDYLVDNPTRNRPLDLLPLFAELDPERIDAAPVEHHLIKARPAFHYRLPNSHIDRANWSLRDPLAGWVRIERLAAAPERLDRLAEAWLERPTQQIGRAFDRFSERLREELETLKS